MMNLETLFRTNQTPFARQLRFVAFCTALQMTSLPAAGTGLARTQTMLRDGWIIKQIDLSKTDIAELNRAANEPDTSWYPASMPSQVQDVLLRQGLIPDPRVGKNAAECSWVFEKDWAYATHFETPDGMGPV